MATKGGGVLLLVLGAMSTSIVGCGKSNKSFNQKSDGVIVQIAQTQSVSQEAKSQEEIQALFPDNKVTVINKEENLYKIQGATLDAVSERMPAAYAEEDLLIQMKETPDLSKRASITETLESINCKAILEGNHAEFGLLSTPEVVAPSTVLVGSADVVFGTQNVPGFDLHWVVEGPPGSQTLTHSTALKISVKPDRPGGYTVALVARDQSSGGCELSGIMLGATHNKKMTKTTAAKGQYSSQKFFHIPLVNAEKAWALSQGEGVTIAIIDSGVNYNHPDLQENIKLNAAEVAGNGLDDDQNGFVDDVYGWDFAIGDEYAYDDESHGTHVAGLAASSVSGVAKKAKILPIKAMLPTGMGTTSSLVSAIYYAVKQKADIINLSLGGPGKASPLMLAAVKKAQAAGILVVAASGNSTDDTDVVQSHLTAFDGSNVLAIAATDELNKLADYSNYGARSVDVAAPGGTEARPLVSTYANTDLANYIGYHGTSMACPVSAGVAALVKSVNPTLNAEQLKAVLVGSAKEVTSLNGKVSSGAMLDAYTAVTNANHIPMGLAGL